MRGFFLVVALGCMVFVNRIEAVMPSGQVSDPDDESSQDECDELMQKAYVTESANLASHASSCRIAFNLDEIINFGLYKNFVAALRSRDMITVDRYLSIPAIRERLHKLNAPMVVAAAAILYEQAPSPR